MYVVWSWLISLVADGFDQLSAQDGGRPIFFDVLNDELRALIVRNEWAGLGIVHGIGQVANQDAVFPPIGHLLDRERAVEDAHVGVDTHNEQRADLATFQEVINLGAVVGDQILGRDAKGS